VRFFVQLTKTDNLKANKKPERICDHRTSCSGHKKQKSPDFSVETALLFLRSSLSSGFGLSAATHSA
jgi:hypothetical protein